MTTPILEVENISLRFGGVTAISEVSFSVEDGELYAIIMNAGLPANWTSSEVPAAGVGTGQFVLPGGGGGSFTYTGATGTVTVP